MSTEVVLLAVLMFGATYPSRALGLMTPVLDRLPKLALDYLQLVGPAILAAISAVSVMTIVDPSGNTVFHIGIEWVGVLACLLITAKTRNLLVGLVVGVAIVAIARAIGLAAVPGL